MLLGKGLQKWQVTKCMYYSKPCSVHFLGHYSQSVSEACLNQNKEKNRVRVMMFNATFNNISVI